LTRQSNNKIAYLDGLRGVAALLVLFHHFFLVFYTSYFNWDPGASHLHGWEIAFGKSVFSVLLNGNFCVSVFFVLSGFVLSRKYFNDNKIGHLVSAAQRRFVRLYLPVAFTLILAYLLLRAHLYFNVPVSKLTHSEWWFSGMWIIDHPAKKLLHCLFFDTMFEGDSTFDTSMWSMTIEVYYSFVVFSFLALTHLVRNRGMLLFAMLIFCFFTYNANLAPFIFGIALNYAEGHKNRRTKGTLMPCIIFLSVGLVLGSYSSNGATEGTIFSAISSDSGKLLATTWFHAIGALLLVLAFVWSHRLQRFISSRLFVFLGYISFSIYLLHPLVIGSFGSYLFAHIYGPLGYNTSVSIVLAATLGVCFVLSWLMTRYIDEKGTDLSKYLYTRYIKRADIHQ
jgi:peptidoglycan/LPS O-acetylase OafA/YrhL